MLVPATKRKEIKAKKMVRVPRILSGNGHDHQENRAEDDLPDIIARLALDSNGHKQPRVSLLEVCVIGRGGVAGGRGAIPLNNREGGGDHRAGKVFDCDKHHSGVVIEGRFNVDLQGLLRRKEERGKPLERKRKKERKE